RRIDPDPQQRVLDDVLGERIAPENSPCKPKRASRMPPRQHLEGAPVAPRGARHEVMIGRPVHAGATRSAVALGWTHAGIVPAARGLVAPQPARSPRQLWETSQSERAIPI